MSLSCSCDYDEAEWWYEAAADFSPLATKRSRKCCSCGKKIAVGDDCVSLRRWRDPSEDNYDLEWRIYGDEVPLPNWYLCERCGGLYMSIDDLGFCCDISQDIAEQIKEYMAEESIIRQEHHAHR